MLWAKQKISLNFYSILFVIFFENLLEFLLSTYTEFIESFLKISKIDVKSKIPKIIEKQIALRRVPLLPSRCSYSFPVTPSATMVIRVCVNGECCAAPVSIILCTVPPFLCYPVLPLSICVAFFVTL